MRPWHCVIATRPFERPLEDTRPRAFLLIWTGKTASAGYDRRVALARATELS